MSSSDYFRQLDALFREAVNLTVEDRERFLDEACGDDDAIRAEVMQLLSHDALTRGAIDHPALGEAMRDVIEPHAGESQPERIGPYRIVRLLGEGGFGSVYLGEQARPIRRKVAIKVIKLGMDTRRIIARFEAERQALAMMDHPNIARVYEAGATEQGRPYFVMEHVEGVPITDYCDRQSASIRHRLELFLRVCNAAQHAHQKGVIHRDIKPSNVLVAGEDEGAEPKVIDFGIAKAIHARLTERTIRTEQQQLIGTPAYMSPEQARTDEDVDTRSDIYSLGVLLYELLTGTTPFDSETLGSAGLSELQRLILEKDPPRPSTRLTALRTTTGISTDSIESEAGSRPGEADPEGAARSIEDVARCRRTDPSSLARAIRGDLDWIVMKAIEKDRTRRYDSASDLARDVERHLRHEPVLAGPPGLRYRAAKFVRRNRVGVTAGGLAAAALVIGCAIALVGLLQAARERDNALLERDNARAVNTFLIDDLLAQAAPERNAVGRAVTVRELLDRAAASVDQGFRGRPELEATIHGVIGDTYTALGVYDHAEKHWRRALELREPTLGPEHEDTILAVSGVALALDYQGRLDEAEPMFGRLVQLTESTFGRTHEKTLKARNNYAETLEAMGKLDDARVMHESILHDRRNELGAEHVDTFESMNNLAAVYFQLGMMPEAESMFRDCWEGRQRVIRTR